MVHTAPEDLSRYKSYSAPISNQDIFTVTPGLFEREFGDLKQAPNESGEFNVLLFGRGDDEDFELKGYNIAVEAFTHHLLKGTVSRYFW